MTTTAQLPAGYEVRHSPILKLGSHVVRFHDTEPYIICQPDSWTAEQSRDDAWAWVERLKAPPKTQLGVGALNFYGAD